jgi:glycosyltransferase involved in cell wall biosynthesis
VEVACSTGGVRARGLQEAGVPVHVLGHELVKRRVSPRYGRALRRLLQDRPLAVVHAHLYANAAAAVYATMALNLPVIHTEHTEASWRRGTARAVSRRVYQHAAHVVAVSSAIGRLLIEGYRVPPERVEVLLPVTAMAPRARSRRLQPSEPVIGLVGRLVPEKGVDVFLRALSWGGPWSRLPASSSWATGPCSPT